jgi:thiol-disulfide isomerase/thioredoxin
MQVIVLVARLVLAGTFAIAGLAKLTDRAGTAKAFVDFGIPDALARPGSVILPLLEFVVAVALLPVPSAWFGAIGALALLLLFSIAIALNLALGRRPDCNCFGQFQSKPIDWSTLLRNLALTVLAAVLVWQGAHGHDPGPSFVQWLGDLTIAERADVIGGALGLCLLAAMVALTVQLLRQQGRLLLRLDALETRLFGSSMPDVTEPAPEPQVGLPIRTPAPAFVLDTAAGMTMSLDDIVAIGGPALLVFTNPNCGPCEALLPEIHDWQRRHLRSLTIVVVAEGQREDIQTKIAARGLGPVLCQREREVATAYQAWGTPAAVLINRDGTIASYVAQGADRIRALVAKTVDGLPMPSSAPPTAPGPLRNDDAPDGRGLVRPTATQRGEKAPSLQLADFSGKPQEVARVRGRSTLLLFWNPNCGYCQRMLDDLKAFDASPPADSPELVLISSGSPEEARAMNLRAPVLLDRESRAASAFGAGGTPMAVLLDGEGHIASEVAAGAHAVFTLAKSGQRPLRIDAA